MNDKDRNKLLLDLVDEMEGVSSEVSDILRKIKAIERKYEELGIGLYGLMPYFYDDDQVQPSDLVQEANSRLGSAIHSGKETLVQYLRGELATENDN